LFSPKKKSTADAHRIICETYSENVIAIRTCAKNDDFNISDKERFGRPAVEEDELRKDGKKSWKTIENTSINLYYIGFFCNKKISKNQHELLHRPNVISNILYYTICR